MSRGVRTESKTLGWMTFSHASGAAASGESGGLVRSDFNLAEYRSHILSLLDHHALRFSDISPLTGDDRRDRVRRFITLVFMDNDREINLRQHGNDLLVQRYNDEAYAEG